MSSSSPERPAAGCKPATPDPDSGGGWSDAAVQRLKDLWADPDLSAAVIARRLGVTRNAVLGKVHRLGLSNRRPRAARPPRAPRAPKPPKRRPASPGRGRLAARAAVGARDRAALDVGPGLVVRLEDIPRQACHWPIGDPHAEAFRFCGRRAPVGPYCDAHRAVAYRPRARAVGRGGPEASGPDDAAGLRRSVP